jgi:hypothetical protein
MSTSAAIGLGLAVVLFGISLWIRRQRRIRRRFTTRGTRTVQAMPVPIMPNASQVLIFIENDGTARELTVADKKYVDTAFSPFDGARPYVKQSYEQRNGWGEPRGYLPRDLVPAGIPIDPAPADTFDPQTPEAVAKSMVETARKYRPAEADKLRFKMPPPSD